MGTHFSTQFSYPPASTTNPPPANASPSLLFCGCCMTRNVGVNSTYATNISYPLLNISTDANDYYRVNGYYYYDSKNNLQVLNKVNNGTNFNQQPHLSSIDNSSTRLYFNSDLSPNVFSHTTTTLWPVVANYGQGSTTNKTRNGTNQYPPVPEYTIGTVAIHPHFNYFYTTPTYWKGGFSSVLNFMNAIWSFGNTGLTIDAATSGSILRQAITSLNTYSSSLYSILYTLNPSGSGYTSSSYVHDDPYFWVALHNWCVPNSDISLIPTVTDELRTVYVSPMLSRTSPPNNTTNSNNNLGSWMDQSLPVIGGYADTKGNQQSLYGFLPEYYYPFVRNGDQTWYNMYLDGAHEIFYIAHTRYPAIRSLLAARGTDMLVNTIPCVQGQDGVDHPIATQGYYTTSSSNTPPDYNVFHNNDVSNDSNNGDTSHPNGTQYLLNIFPGVSADEYAVNDVKGITGIQNFNSIFGATWSTFGSGVYGNQLTTALINYQGGIFSRIYADSNQSPNIYYCYSPHMYPGQICFFIVQQSNGSIDDQNNSTWIIPSTGNYSATSYIDQNNRAFLCIRCGFEYMQSTWKSLLSTSSVVPTSVGKDSYLDFGPTSASDDTVVGFDPLDGSNIDPYTLTYMTQSSGTHKSFFNSDIDMYYKQYTLARDFKIGQTFRAFLAHRSTDLSDVWQVPTSLKTGQVIGSFANILKSLMLPTTDGSHNIRSPIPIISNYTPLPLTGHGYNPVSTFTGTNGNGSGFVPGKSTSVTITNTNNILMYNTPTTQTCVPIIIYFDSASPLFTWVSWSELNNLYVIMTTQAASYSSYIGGINVTSASNSQGYNLNLSDFTTGYKLLATFGYGIYAHTINIGVITNPTTSVAPNGSNFVPASTFVQGLTSDTYNTMNLFEVGPSTTFTLVDISDYIKLPAAGIYHSSVLSVPVVIVPVTNPGNANDGIIKPKPIAPWIIILISCILGLLVIIVITVAIVRAKSPIIDPNTYATRTNRLV
jgi:hypothetical protein